MKKGKLVVVEGPDGAGKTTFIRQLKERVQNMEYAGVYIFHEGPPPKNIDLFKHYLKKILDAQESTEEGILIIFDRLYLGEMIYGPVARGESRLTEQHRRILSEMISMYGGMEILCLPTLPNVLANYKFKIREADDYLKNQDKLIEVYKLYEQYAGDQWIYDYHTTSVTEFVRYTNEYLNFWR